MDFPTRSFTRWVGGWVGERTLGSAHESFEFGWGFPVWFLPLEELGPPLLVDGVVNREDDVDVLFLGVETFWGGWVGGGKDRGGGGGSDELLCAGGGGGGWLGGAYL